MVLGHSADVVPRECVYVLLLCVFLLPAEQTWEETNKQSRVVVLLDITPSLTDPRATDEVSTNPGRKVKTRMDVILDFLSDNDVAFLKRLLEKNPVAIYTFGTRLDESPTVVNPGETWTRNDWESLALRLQAVRAAWTFRRGQRRG